MKSNFLRVFLTLTTIIILAGVGCAKKNKPDNGNELAGALSAGSIQEKDMNLDISGSDTGKIEGLYSIHFEYDKSTLSGENRGLLVKNANWLKHNSNKSLQIEGHCDRHGSIEYNLGLGQRRADVVKRYLINLGLGRDRFSTISYGKERMIDPSETDEADSKNRRANFKLIDSPKIKQMTNL